MPQIEPERLLKCLLPLLDKQTSSIKSDKEVDKIIAFMTRGGWDMMFTWIEEATATQNYSLLCQIERLLLQTPTNISRLRENDLPKLIKNISKDCEHEETRVLAQELVKKWIHIAKEDYGKPQTKPDQNINIQIPAVEHGQTGSQPIHSYTITSPPNPTLGLSENFENGGIIESDNQQLMDMSIYINGTNLDDLEFNPDAFSKAVEKHLGMSSDQNQSEQEAAKGSEDSKQVKRVERRAFPSSNGDTYSLFKSSPTAIILKVNKSPVGGQGLAKNNAQADDVDKKKGKKNEANKTINESSDNEVKVYSNKKRPLPPPPVKIEIPSSSSESLASSSSKDQKPDKVRTKTEGGAKRTAPNSEKKKRRDLELARQNEMLNKKIREQKKIVRKREKEKQKQELQMQQIEKDKETLQAVGLGALVKLGATSTPSAKFNKIPKRSSFSDALSELGGTDLVEKEKVIKLKSKPTDVDAKNETKISPDKSSEKPSERKPSSVKVPRDKNRSMALLVEMGVKSLDGEKEIKKSSSDKSAGSLSRGKRPSLDNKSVDSKKPKLSKEEEEKEKKVKEAKKSEAKKEAKSVKQGIVESDIFGLELEAAITTKHVKRKRIPSSTESKEKESKDKSESKENTRRGSNSSIDSKPPPASPIVEPDLSKPKFNFYLETMKDKEEEEIEKVPTLEKKIEEDMCSGFTPDEEEGKLKSVLVIHRERGRKKKNVTWKEDDNLKEFHFFEFDETERINVSKLNAMNNVHPAKNFNEMKLKERSDERFQLQSHNSNKIGNKNDKVFNVRPWHLPFIIVFDIEPPRPIVDSNENRVQDAREKTTLGTLYFPNFVPSDSPSEPDTHPDIRIEEKKIPSEDIPGMTKCTEFLGLPWPDPKVNLDIFDYRKINSFDFNPNMPSIPAVSTDQFNALGNFPQFPVQNPLDVNPWQNPIVNNLFSMANVPTNSHQPNSATGWNGVDNGFGFNNGTNPNLLNMPNPGFGSSNFGFGFPNVPAVPQNAQMLPDFRSPGGGNFSNAPSNSSSFRSNNRSTDRGRDREDRNRKGFHNDRERDRDRDRDSRFNRDRDRNERFDRDQRDANRNTKGRIKTVPCKFFTNGFCSKKDLCDFLHMENSSNTSRFNSFGSSNRGYEVKKRESSRSPPDDRSERSRNESPPKRELKDDSGNSVKDNFDTFEQPPSSPTEQIDGIYPPGCEPTTFS